MRKLLPVFLFLSFQVSLFAQFSWKKTTDFPGNGRMSAIAFSINNTGYYGLGRSSYGSDENYQDFYKFDPTTKVWTQLNNVSLTTTVSSVAFVIDGYAYVGLGKDNSGNYSTSFYKYAPETDSWTSIADFTGSPRAYASAFVINGKAYVGCGSKGSTIYSDMFCYDPTANTWTQVTGLSSGIQRAVSFSINGKGYIVSGLESTSFILSGVDEYDPETDKWTNKIFATSSLQNRYYATSFVLDGKAYICGGNLNASSDLVYDPTTNTVESYGTSATGESSYYDPCSFVLNGKPYIFCGALDEGYNYNYIQSCWVHDDGTTSVDNNSMSYQVNLYPNPASDILNIKASTRIGNVKIYNYKGQLVIEENIEENNTTINVEDLNSGVYIINFLNQTMKFSIK